MCEVTPSRALCSLSKVEQEISRFWSESKDYLLEHNGQEHAWEHGRMGKIIIGCDNPCSLEIDANK